MNLSEKPTWQVQDSTKIQVYLDCPRRYFYEFVLGWRQMGGSIHLVYGTSLHLALEYIELHNEERATPEGRKQVADAAFQLFAEDYRKESAKLTDEPHSAKNPMTAMNALLKYVDTYKKEDSKVLYTEIYGQVMINLEGDTIHYKMDTIGERLADSLIFGRDHKTSSNMGRQWVDQWTLSFQMGTYLHVLFSAFPQEKVWGMVINGISPKATSTEFLRVPVQKTMDMMAVWLWHANEYVGNIKKDFQRLSEAKESDLVMQAFPQNPQSCTKYFGCPFRDFCSLWPNPLRRADSPPLGFIEEHWDPKSEAEKAKKIINVDMKEN